MDLGASAFRRIFAVMAVTLGLVVAALAQTTTRPAHMPLTTQTAGDVSFVVHDPSTIIRCNNQYWIYYTADGVGFAHSPDLIHWERGTPDGLFKTPAWVKTTVPRNRWGNFWAPEVARVGERYLVYYSVSTFASNVSAIGLQSSPTLDPSQANYKWTDQGIVVHSKRGDNFNAIDPAVCSDADGGMWLSFGSFWSGIKLVQLDPATGLRISPDSKIYSLAWHSTIEASYLYRHGGFYYLFVNWGLCCRGIYSTYNVRVGRSEKITGPYLDKSGKDMLHDAGSPVLQSEDKFIGPGQVGIFTTGGREWISFHYESDPMRRPTLAIRPLDWDGEGWPVVGRKPEISQLAASTRPG